MQSTIARLTCIAPPEPFLPSNMLCPENITDTNSVVSVVSPAELCRNLLDSVTKIDNRCHVLMKCKSLNFSVHVPVHEV